jgi:uncharacterized membrane protein
MEEWLVYLTENAVIIINLFALIVIAYGTIEAFIEAIKIIVGRRPTSTQRTDIWLGFGRWLVAGLTFQLAADVIETAVEPSWDEIGRFAAIAAIRTVLNYFLNKDMEELRIRDKERSETPAIEP